MSAYIRPEELLENMRDCYQKKVDVLAERHKKALAQIDEMALQLSRYEEKNYVILPIDAYGKPIHVGDKVFWYAVGYFDVIGIGEQVVLDKGDSRYAIVSPGVLEVVDVSGRDYIVRFYDSDEPDDYARMEEVVRCCDCEHLYGRQCGRNLDGFDVEPDGFCKWGERKQ